MMNTRLQIKLAVVLLIMLGIVFSWPLLQEAVAKYIPIRYVQVEGAFQYIDKQDIKMKISPLVQAGYFSVDLQAMQQSVMDLPWAERVQVQRIWPDRLKLRIYEQKPVIRWQAHSLLNERGEVFRPLNIDRFQSLPLLYAPNVQRQQLLEVMHGLSISLMGQGLYLAEFRVNERQSWLLSMENGLSIQLGRLQPLEKFSQLMKAFIVSGGELVNKMAYVDMRYPNGYAVRWRENEQISW
ncbi:cell division protein FtsQ [Bathymodiolus platifrons methanotrophic gill symbiont]|uniref:cell division protein FtsQ/DivIB n=1 Tax=Bathymodiolus platifrons methanotrophic gill symbiont TaxID=113268 RepID=UPI000B41234E|nr:cell division protein FtsQ/DivIB [Bathymodiolus platifrons methanotrophic gill symbiont]MCK5869945.1 FtsQ-type POTRA domain-containing protein [Methyloprofundus sp.]TXK96159.1 cell division protein FtsQ [Methylococcaceae bacterium CS4]TXK97759.1 cell division protein FtsQ [Methylococcaceae bacterium CS5]TXL05801.1 cell division protein FtsQ [Methylococcaceae bacterium CS1]TXL08151.1 cell division protein FtsQ [Methylococcaceae bacterium CS3]TXL10274.1 cell division protein FtsQ [Methylococ